MPKAAPKTKTPKDVKLPKGGFAGAVVANHKEPGLLPHEILLRAARGEKFKIMKLYIVKYATGPHRGEEKERRWIEEEYVPTFHEQMDCAKAAAAYFAPRLASQLMKVDDKTSEAIAAMVAELGSQLPG